ncbi:hypothetical protein IIA15_03385 [candidate division TA06 bacterium]|nr:hypothetical protein [candidate division TA06 bacterium]
MGLSSIPRTPAIWLKKEMGERAGILAQEFGWDRVAQRVEKVLKRVVGN